MLADGRTSTVDQFDKVIGERVMIVHRRTWFYRLAGQHFARVITFRNPITATKVKETLRRTGAIPVELWGCSS
jgi:hypothetical protein